MVLLLRFKTVSSRNTGNASKISLLSNPCRYAIGMELRHLRYFVAVGIIENQELLFAEKVFGDYGLRTARSKDQSDNSKQMRKEREQYVHFKDITNGSFPRNRSRIRIHPPQPPGSAH